MKKLLLQINGENIQQKLDIAKQASALLSADIDCLYLKKEEEPLTPNLSAAMAVASPQVISSPGLTTSIPNPELNHIPATSHSDLRDIRNSVNAINNPSLQPAKLIVSEQEPREAFLKHGLYYDLILLDNTLDTTDRLGLSHDGANHIATITHKPILTLPANHCETKLAGHALIIWNADAQTASAINRSIALLQQASQVSLLVLTDANMPTRADDEIKNLALNYLTERGIKAQVLQGSMPEQEESLGAIIEGKYDYVVAGAYGHSKLHDLLTGNALRKALQTVNTPLFLAA